MLHPVRKLRKERSLSLQDAAAQLGMSKANLSRIETGVHGVSDPLKLRIVDWSGGAIQASELILASARPDK